MSIPPSKTKRVLSVFVLAMLNVSVMASLRNLPLVADYGLSAVTYFLIVAALFLIPCALVSAELATGWPSEGGVYTWVKQGLGGRWGFLAVWVQWSHNLSWYPVILSFVATTIAYVVDPGLLSTKYYVLSVILFSFWSMTFLNYLGVKTSSLFSTFGVIVGTILPGLLIITLGASWLINSNQSQIVFSFSSMIPSSIKLDNLVFLAGIFLAFAGLEVTAVHVKQVVNPQKNYPRSIILAALITFVLFMFGSLAIAIVIPKSNIQLATGLMEAFKVFFDHYNMGWFLPIMALLLAFGAVAEVNAWIIGPVKGLHSTAIDGNLPKSLQKTNRHNVPTNLLLFQAYLVSLASLVFLQMPSLSSSFWILSALSAQSYLVMYILMFIAAIKLRYSMPHVKRAYRIPYGNFGMWAACFLGISSCLFGIFIGFIPPAQFETGHILVYESVLITGLFVMCGIPLIIYRVRKPHWALEAKHDK